MFWLALALSTLHQSEHSKKEKHKAGQSPERSHSCRFWTPSSAGSKHSLGINTFIKPINQVHQVPTVSPQKTIGLSVWVTSG